MLFILFVSCSHHINEVEISEAQHVILAGKSEHKKSLGNLRAHVDVRILLK